MTSTTPGADEGAAPAEDDRPAASPRRTTPQKGRGATSLDHSALEASFGP